MSFRKFQADKIFTGTDLLEGDNVLITDERGIVQEIVSAHEAGDDIQNEKGWLSPGFINCHCHLELSRMRGLIPEKTGLVDFVFSVVTQRHFPDEEILEAIANAEAEMILNGTVAVGDICNNLLTLPQKQKGNLPYYNFIEVSGWLPGIAEQRFERSKAFYETFIKTFPSSLVPHAPYSVSEDLWNLIQPFYQDKVVSIHNQETAFEDELFLDNSGDFLRMYQKMNLDHSFFKHSGKSSLQTYFRNLKGASNVLLVHNTFTKEEDILFANQQSAINDQQLYWCLCINANQYIENALPPVETLRKNHGNIVLGTDSLTSNWSLSIWDEIKTVRKNFPAIPLEEVLGWATLNGAKALQMEEQLGSFETGKKPGVLLMDDANHQLKRLI
ncbi:MAG: amidohydrolase family protein [Segetibacter sp.]|nr:amidohydrolase family protein [Segetibacter sp.]